MRQLLLRLRAEPRSCCPRPSSSRSVSLFLARSVPYSFPTLVTLSSTPSPGAAPPVSLRAPSPTRPSLVQLAPRMKFAALAAAAALFGASTVSASAAVHGHQDVALHRRGADRLQRLTKRASLDLSFPFRAHATDASKQSVTSPKRILTKVAALRTVYSVNCTRPCRRANCRYVAQVRFDSIAAAKVQRTELSLSTALLAVQNSTSTSTDAISTTAIWWAEDGWTGSCGVKIE